MKHFALQFVITTYRNKIEVELGMGDHGWVAIYSTLCTTSVMFLSGILGKALLRRRPCCIDQIKSIIC